MKKEKQTFLTEEFYKSPITTLDILNKLVKEKQVADKDMYQSGTFLFMEVYENERTKEILKPIISDLESYKEFNNKNFASDESTQIGLCALQDEHAKYFESDDEIMWDNDSEEFVLKGMLEDE